MDITIGNRSEETGRFNFVLGADGDVSFDDTEAHAVVGSALEFQGAWWADPEHGSTLAQLRNLTARTPSQADASLRAAEAPLEAAGAITGLQVQVEQDRRYGRLLVDLAWTTAGGGAGNASLEL